MNGRHPIPRISDLDTYPRRWVHLSVAAEFLEINYRTLCAWIQDGRIDAEPYGKFRRIHIDELRRFQSRLTARE